MKRLPSRLRRLDDALADLPLDEPMLLTELDGFLTGILLGPEPILPDEWMQSIWGLDDHGIAPFDDPLDAQWFADAVMAHRDTIQRDLARGKPQPIFDIDERNGDVLWESWVDGFADAMELRSDGWAGLLDSDDADEAEASSRLAMLIAIARDESPLDSMQINAFQQQARGEIIAVVRQLYAARLCKTVAAPVAPVREGKVGRNDPCPCGSGRKFKRCCANA